MIRTIRNTFSAGVVLLVIAMFAVSCDTAPGAPDMMPAAPTVGNLEVTPDTASSDTLSVTEEGELRIPLGLSVDVSGNANRVAYSIQWQFHCRSGIFDQRGDLEAFGEGRYGIESELIVPRGRRGAYRVNVWAIGQDGYPSNEAASTFHLTGTSGGPPEILGIEVPESLTPPADLRVVMRADHPDGLEQIAGAYVESPGLGRLPMNDTDTSGNNQACNGVYSAGFFVPEGTPPGFAMLTFQVFDRDGTGSTPETVFVEVLP